MFVFGDPMLPYTKIISKICISISWFSILQKSVRNRYTVEKNRAIL